MKSVSSGDHLLTCWWKILNKVKCQILDLCILSLAEQCSIIGA
ncbi:hypothetical protein HMPREF0201_02525 [Cedecea davisae DSM 4568]|uniref:Uncharacterized protein n=1 Tax=Cedecea davisae DSM 4568 TaxID=566551 RepID=S3IT85_9ENTR|nr:hypothetical protein HMPREF0201_02525 [Cedecea davisae DSM 4568]